eukprot:TRINITY_DN27820_c0_g1_i1.p1 TRINITY_DN27820_c0_g1~~TRINITY_DN27820_c0_g1_i1.p1  ORF type:complete len:237 (-),score=52.14 TRINITY_DN27820_c0_g1_i1:252-962(-)
MSAATGATTGALATGANGRIDLEALKARLAGKPAAAPPPEATVEKGVLPPWTEGTRLGPDGTVRTFGEWLQEKWELVRSADPQYCGMLGGPGMEKEGGPPDRTTELTKIEKSAGADLNVARESALHAVFSMLYWVHQEMVKFQPNLSVAAAGQTQKTNESEELFFVMLKALNLAAQVARDIRNTAYSRYGREKHGLKDANPFARGLAEEARKHSAEAKTYLNDTMMDSIGLSTGGG